MDKILEALSKLLPQENLKEVSEAIKGYLAEAEAELKQQYDSKLEEAYEDLSKDLTEAEQTAETGYNEALTMINSLRLRLQTQNEEFDAAMDEGYEEAYQQLLAERAKNEKLEMELLEQFQKDFEEFREGMIEQLTDFMEFKNNEIYETARRDIMNDPRLAEERFVLDKIVDIVTNHMTEEGLAAAHNKKLEESDKKVKELQSQVKMLESRTIRLSNDNNRLTEEVRKAATVITEQTENKEKERNKKAKNVEGRGRLAEGVIPETKDKSNNDSAKDDEVVVEGFKWNAQEFRDMKTLAGIKKK